MPAFFVWKTAFTTSTVPQAQELAQDLELALVPVQALVPAQALDRQALAVRPQKL